MDEFDASTLAHALADMAERNYRNDGYLHPAMMFASPEGTEATVLLTSRASDNMQRATAAVAAGMCSVIDPPVRWVALVSEAWGLRAPDDGRPLEEVDADFPHGELERRRTAGDTSVHTVLMINVMGTADPEDSFGVTVDIDEGYVREDIAGAQMGGIADRFYEAMRIVPLLRVTRPPGTGTRQVAEALSDLIEVLMIPADGGPGEPITAFN